MIVGYRPVGGGPGRKGCLDCREDLERTIRHIEQNPVKIRKPIQKWEFVVPYDGWLLGLRTPYQNVARTRTRS
jgi:hypothetical protein